MKIKKTLFVAALLALTLPTLSFKRLKQNRGDKGFAVVELFTSEGCSSCPPADELVAKIEKESAGKPIYILAYHVDYWDRLGWKDAFSSAAFSRRQYQYKNWLHIESVYTPQAIVNGQKEFVGSEESAMRNAIKTGLEKEASAQLNLSDIKTEKNRAAIQYHIQGNTRNTDLLVALVQKSAQTRVKRGENAGRTLSHVQIVRELQTLPLEQDSGNITIALPREFDPKGYELIAFLQDTATGVITGATKAAF